MSMTCLYRKQQCCVIGLTLAVVLLVFSSLAKAQNKDDDEPRRTTINFEDELVTGSAQKPELFYLLQKKQFNYKRLIRLRENFLPEMRKTAEELEYQGGVD